MPSMSARTIVYKGMLLADQVGSYYKDLQDPRVVSALALVHQRFSTNTFPTWDLAHPFRMIAHNGEINTLRGNVNWIRARQGAISSPMLGEDLDKVWPLIYDGQSDSASFDNALELLVMGGYSIAHAMMMLIPEAWEGHTHDGRQPARVLRVPRGDDGAVGRPGGDRVHRRPPDRRHARPQRPAPGALHRHRRRPGDHGLRVRLPADSRGEDRQEVAPAAGQDVPRRPRGGPHHRRQGAEGHARRAPSRTASGSSASASSSTTCPSRQEQRERARASALLDRQQAFAYTQEDIKFILTPMARNGEEPIGSMGNDSPLAVLSNKNKTLYHYFKQLFAQVTNPPIDPIREELVMSLVSFIGPKPNLLGIDEMNPPLRLEVSQPVLDFDADGDDPPHRPATPTASSAPASSTSPTRSPGASEAIEARLASLCAQAEDAVRSGYTHPRSSPTARWTATTSRSRRCSRCRRSTSTWSTRACAPPPAWWSRPARRARCITSRCSAATAPRPCIPTSPRDPRRAGRAGPAAGNIDGKKACKNFVKAIGKGLRKVMSKMGISTYMSYTGAQIFEAVGLSRALVDKYFTGTTSNVEGIGVFEVAEEAIRIHRAAFGDDPVLAGRARCRRRVRVPRARRGAHVDARRDRQAAALDAQQQLRDLQGIRADHQRPVASGT